jgi:hypothetical protein
MKIKIGPYINWIGPYQIADMLCFWVKPVKDEHGFKDKPDWVHQFGKRLSKNSKGEESLLSKFCHWVHSKRNRTVKVKIDRWDTWNMDSTLAIIVLPMLKQLRDKKHGAPYVRDEDVPEGLNLRSTEAPPKENEWDTDENHFKRWDWVLDEIIWGFEQEHPDYDWDAQYHTGVIDTEWIELDNGMFEMKKTEKDTSHFDIEGYKAHADRIDNAMLLFGRYYRGLWD